MKYKDVILEKYPLSVIMTFKEFKELHANSSDITKHVIKMHEIEDSSSTCYLLFGNLAGSNGIQYGEDPSEYTSFEPIKGLH